MITLALIPVIELGYNNQGISPPDQYPYWDYAHLWNQYHADCYKKVGFLDDFKPYSPGSSFCKILEISERNLIKIIIDHTQDLRDGIYERSQVVAFFGGYLLQINGTDQYFPQCCGTLSDIQYWENLATNKAFFYEGHPEPQIKIQGEQITFDFTVDEHDEGFFPPPAQDPIHFYRSDLENAVELAKKELEIFEQRLEKMNHMHKLHIDDIGKLLIWGDN